MAGAGLISFAGMFVFGLLTKKTVSDTQQASAAQTSAEDENLKLMQAQMLAGGGAVDNQIKTAMSEKQLKDLVYEVREKIREYDNKLQGLASREQKLQTAQEMLKKDIQDMDNLRIELASMVSAIKGEQDKLEKSRINISNIEKNNLASIAATYDKMDAAQAGKILSNMNRADDNDAVKILYYMSDRTKAKVLASIAETEPAVSAEFSQRLKRITEKE
jgi:hypothetical protein